MKADRCRDFDFTPASPESDRAFLDRITVNYLRHQLTRYEALLDRTFGRVGAEDAYLAIRRKVLIAIARQYPNLAAECDRQISAKQFSKPESLEAPN